MRTLIILFLCLFCIIHLKSQNVGVGTNDPKAKLHVKSDQGLTQAASQNFNEGAINPGQQAGNINWRVSSQTVFEGAYSGQAPASMKEEEQAILVIPYNVPTEKSVIITFFYRNDVPANQVQASISYPGGGRNLNQKISSWQQENINYISTSSSGELRFTLTALEDIVNPLIFIDNITVSFLSDPALRMEDGSQHNGAYMRSDQFGNASWHDLRGEIDQEISDATQTLLFRTTNNRLEIENGNQVRIQALSNDDFKSLELNENTLELTSGASFTIGKAPNSKFFHYDGEDGHISWGADNVGYEPTSTHTTRWGFENKADGNFSTAWGRKNFTNSLYSTVFGNGNIISDGEYAAVWGLSNEVQGDYSTVWGEGNATKQGSSYSNMWGKENSIAENSDQGTAWGFNNSINGHFHTVWGRDNVVSVDSFATAWGMDNQVTGKNGTSWGTENIVNGPHGTSWGVNNNVQGTNGTAWGDDNYVSGKNATAIGFDSRAIGDNSMAIGQNARANTYGELAIGSYNASAGSETSWEPDDNAFSIGDGHSGLFGASNSFVVKKNGKVGINVNNPEYSLDIALQGESEGIRLGNYDFSSGNATRMMLQGRNQSIIFGEDENWRYSINYSTESDVFTILDDLEHVITIDNKKIGLANFNPTRLLDLGQNSAMKPGTSTWEVPSDGRLKRDIKPFKQGLEVIQKINPVWFTYNGTGGIPEGTTVGTVAQELEEVAPYMVSEWDHIDENKRSITYKSVNYHAMNFMLVNAVKEQQEQIDELRVELEELKKLLKEK